MFKRTNSATTYCAIENCYHIRAECIMQNCGKRKAVTAQNNYLPQMYCAPTNAGAY